jgi:hypothetical protein
VSGSTITFLPSSGTLSSSDTIDFILVLGNVLDIGTPSDSTVTNAKTNFASSSSAAGLQIKGDGTSDGTSGTLQLNCSANSHGIKLASPAHSAGQSYTLTFPTTAPSADKALITDGSGNLSFGTVGGITLGTTQASTSGTAIDFTGIPSTAKRISVLFRGVSSSGSDTGVLVQLGTSSGFVTSGYISSSNYDGGGSSDTTGFYMLGITTSQTLSGIMTIAHMGSNIYTQAHSGKRSTTYGVFGGGDVSVGGTVTQVRIKQVSGGSFDAGAINVTYE